MVNGFKSNPEKSSKPKVAEHIPSGFSMPTKSLFKNIKIKRPRLHEKVL